LDRWWPKSATLALRTRRLAYRDPEWDVGQGIVHCRSHLDGESAELETVRGVISAMDHAS